VRAYELMELTQGDAHLQARADLEALEAEAERRGWARVALLAAAGGTLYALVHDEDRDRVDQVTRTLLHRTEAAGFPELTALSLALRAVAAGGRGDSATLLGDAGRALALIEDETLPALDRCMVLVVCGAAYNTLSLWELTDQMYDAAGALVPLCERPVHQPALAMNRVLLRLEWAAALFELAERHEALVQLQRAAEAADLALGTAGLPALWRGGAEACRDVLAFVRQAFGMSPGPDGSLSVDQRLVVLHRHRTWLADSGDVEVLPLLDPLVVLGLCEVGRSAEAVAAAADLVTPGSSSTGARSFPQWVRAHVLTGDAPGQAVAAHQAYGLSMARARWAARLGVLAAARSKIATERLAVEHARLSRDILLDPLTGLSNRRGFDEWLTQSRLLAGSAALILVDLDVFKEVNDVHGHAVGDEVLRQVGRQVARHVRAGDMALRLGGDEFAVVMHDDVDAAVTPPHAMLDLATERAQAISDAVANADWGRLVPGLTVRVSVGVAAGPLGPEHPGGPGVLYREADARLYAAKSLGRAGAEAAAPRG
jgi:diguanylate cyclase (GGDEF)-like protein